MSEKEQLIELNAQMSSCIKAVERIEIALIGDKFGNLGLLHRVDTMESKLKKLDKYLWMLIGMFSLGIIPIGYKFIPMLKDIGK